uniref:Serine hydrolase domain-containing protein n=1 Tax=Arcella intermedia TaxID=1963864 RepID=A0A6B2LFI1_9EUKA
MIYCHGNACDIGGMYQEFEYYSKFFQLNVIGVEYPGYGVSPGLPNASDISRDTRIVWEFLVGELNIPPGNIIVFGRSIGTGVACRLVYDLQKLQTAPAALILQSPYRSISHIADDLMGPVVGLLAPKIFDNEAFIKEIQVPLLFIHGTKDTLIASSHSQELYQLSKAEKKLIHLAVGADHNFWNFQDDICDPIVLFLTSYFTPIPCEGEMPSIPEDLFQPPSLIPEPQNTNGGFLSFFSQSIQTTQNLFKK